MLYQKMNLNPISDSGPDMDFEIVRLISGKQYAEAYQMLSNQLTPTISNLYNMALCMFEGKAYSASLEMLDETYSKLQPFMSHAIQGDAISESIQEVQRGYATYLNPVTDYYVSRFPCTLKRHIYRLKIDCYKALGRWSDLVRTADQLEHKDYKNVREALKEACGVVD